MPRSCLPDKPSLRRFPDVLPEPLQSHRRHLLQRSRLFKQMRCARHDGNLLFAPHFAEREPVYGTADITIASRDVPHDRIVDEVIVALHAWLCGSDTATNAVGAAP